MYLEDGVEMAIFGDTGKKALQIHCSGPLGHRALSGDIKVVLRRWSWKGHLLVALGKTSACSLFSFLGDRALLDNRVVLLIHFGDTGEEILHIHCSGLLQERALS